jgi:hypothetical protein
LSNFQSYYIKVGVLRFYSGNTPSPYFFSVPFRGAVTGPVDRARAGETLVLDRGRFTADAHYVSPPDDPLLAPLPFSCNFRLANSEPNFSKLLTIIKPPGGVNFKNIGGRSWISSKSTTQIRNSDPLGQVLATTPPFSDSEKHTVNIEILWTDPQSVANRGFKWGEVYFSPDQKVVEGTDVVTIDLTGQVYGAISLITAFDAGVES